MSESGTFLPSGAHSDPVGGSSSAALRGSSQSGTEASDPALEEGIGIENAGWRDFNEVRRLEKACFPVDAWPFWDTLAVLTLPDVVRLKAVASGRTVGFIAVDIRHRDHLAWIATICVDPAYRRRGVASTLIRAVEARLQVARLRLSVRMSNQGARRLYLGLGFEEAERWPRYYQDGEDALVMEKTLTSS